MTPTPPPPWPHLGSEKGPDLRVFRLRFDRLLNPRNQRETKATILETPDWVNVVALTPDQRLVVVYQYRFGRKRVTLEIPAGMVDPGETPQDAARRELREETGYGSDDWDYLGAVEPNPAFQDNLCHHYLARSARPLHARDQDQGEDIRFDTISLEEAAEGIKTGRIIHSLAITALTHVLDLRTRAP